MIQDSKFNDNFLRVEDLEVGTEYCKIAYLTGFKTGINKLARGYHTIYFKDATGASLLGNFNCKDSPAESGKTLQDMKNRPVKIRFTASEFNGSITLDIIEIETYDPTGFPFKDFIGSVSKVEESYAAVNSILTTTLGEGITVDARYKDLALNSIYDGKCGGYMKLLELVIYDLVSYQSLPEISLRILMEVFYQTQIGFFNYMYAKQKADVVRKSDLIDILEAVKSSNRGSECLPITIDCVSYLIGLTDNIENVYAIIIAKAFKCKLENLSLISVYSTMVLGAEKIWGEYKLLKY